MNCPHMVLRRASIQNAPLVGGFAGAPVGAAPVCESRYLRSSSFSQVHSAGGLKNAYQRIAQRIPTTPVITNDIRHPVCRISQATKGADNAGPAKVPALKMAVAKPRSLAGNHCRTTLPQIGNEAASPIPRLSRAPNM